MNNGEERDDDERDVRAHTHHAQREKSAETRKERRDETITQRERSAGAMYSSIVRA